MWRGTGRGKLVVAVLLVLLGIVSDCKQAAAGKGYVIGVVPQMPPVTMYSSWSPFVERLKKETGRNFKLKVYESMSDFESDYGRGTPDFLFSNPTQAVVAHCKQGYIPLVRSSKKIAGILFVRKDSEIRSVKDLRNKEVAFVGARNV